MDSYFYDFHIHSCLSPCGDNDMTPANITGLAKLLGLDMIAITDHNTCKNCPAALLAGKEQELLVIPGMELCTMEEIHMICLFPDLPSAMSFDTCVSDRIPCIQNRPDIFGEQQIMDAADHIIGMEDRLLINATDIALEESIELVQSFGGICYPAHIDRPANSILASLGNFPPGLKVKSFEISPLGNIMELEKQHPALINLRLLTCSDAHYLENISQAVNRIRLLEKTAEAVIDKLKNT